MVLAVVGTYSYVQYVLRSMRIDPLQVFSAPLPANIKVLSALNIGDAALVELFETEAHFKLSIVVVPQSEKNKTAQIAGTPLVETLLDFREKKQIPDGMSPALLRYALAQIEPLSATKIQAVQVGGQDWQRDGQIFETTKSANYAAYFDYSAEAQWLVLALKKGEPVNLKQIEPIVRLINPQQEFLPPQTNSRN